MSGDFPSPGPATPALRWFCREQTLRFSHCDPAGIVFYPQYFVLFNGLVEDWFDEGLEIGYADFIATRRLGLPTAHLECDFLRPSRMGEVLTLALSVERIGERSFTLALEARGPEGARLRARQVIVTTSLETHRAIALPADLRERLAQFTRSAPSAPA